MNHTPGPWTIGDNAWDRNKNVYQDYGNKEIIAKASPKFSNLSESEQLSNARLIAAAPELLDACKALIEYYEHMGSGLILFTDAVQLAKNAIMKATPGNGTPA